MTHTNSDINVKISRFLSVQGGRFLPFKGYFSFVHPVYDDGDVTGDGDIRCRTETIHSDIQGDHPPLCRFIET